MVMSLQKQWLNSGLLQEAIISILAAATITSGKLIPMKGFREEIVINKQQWAGIENTLKSGAPVRFLYQGHEIEVMKITVRETKMAYVVAEGGHALVGFLKKDDKAYNPLSEVFLRKKLINPHARIARSIAKERGGKAYLKRKENRYMTEKTLEVTDTFFSTARTVVTHFRKIKGLELAPGGFVSLNAGGDNAA